ERLGRFQAIEAAVVPVRAHHRTLAVVYGDAPEGGRLPDLVPLYYFAEAAGRALDAVVSPRRTQAPPPSQDPRPHPERAARRPEPRVRAARRPVVRALQPALAAAGDPGRLFLSEPALPAREPLHEVDRPRHLGAATARGRARAARGPRADAGACAP